MAPIPTPRLPLWLRAYTHLRGMRRPSRYGACSLPRSRCWFPIGSIHPSIARERSCLPIGARVAFWPAAALLLATLAVWLVRSPSWLLFPFRLLVLPSTSSSPRTALYVLILGIVSGAWAGCARTAFAAVSHARPACMVSSRSSYPAFCPHGSRMRPACVA